MFKRCLLTEPDASGGCGLGGLMEMHVPAQAFLDDSARAERVAAQIMRRVSKMITSGTYASRSRGAKIEIIVGTSDFGHLLDEAVICTLQAQLRKIGKMFYLQGHVMVLRHRHVGHA